MLSRRRMLLDVGAAGVSFLTACHSIARENEMDDPRSEEIGLRSPLQALDHFLLGVPDLDLGIDWIRKITGVQAVIGGSHPGAGTRNALLSLGNRQYLEIISLDPRQKESGSSAELIKKLTGPQVIGWAASTRDINADAARAKAAGCELDGPNEGSRITPAGRMLRWKSVRARNTLGRIIPFLIEWGNGTVHPSEDSPSGCRLYSLRMGHPEPDRARELLEKLSISAPVNAAREPKLLVELETPEGKVELS